jgi:urease accessory protein
MESTEQSGGLTGAPGGGTADSLAGQTAAPCLTPRPASRPARSAAALAVAAVSLLAAGPALAHSGHEGVSTFQAGLTHPIGGWDHLAAMLGVGFWAAQQQDRRALAVLPGLFVAGVAGGAALALAGLAVPLVEVAILISVAVIAALVLARVQAGLLVAGAGVLLLALWHGLAHGIEAPADGSLAGYMAGFCIATALLHALGAVAAWLTGQTPARLGASQSAAG